MTNNEIFNKFMQLTGLWKDIEKIRYIFELGGCDFEISKSLISNWRKSTDKAVIMKDCELQYFIKGLFEYRDLKAKNGIQVFNFGIDFSDK